MTKLISAFRIRRAGTWSDAIASVSLTYEDRFLRRRRLVGDGAEWLVDLPETVSLDHGDALELETGEFVEIISAPEPLLEVKGPSLAQLAWHIGNRHAPCQIEHRRLLIQHDHVMGDMLRRLGAVVTAVTEPFNPEGGAYGHGRTLPHTHEHSHP